MSDKLVDLITRTIKRTIGSRLCDIDRGEDGQGHRFVCPEYSSCRCNYTAKAILKALDQEKINER